MQEDLVQALRQALQSIVGTTCWAYFAGAGTGSHLDLELGAKLPRRQPLRNPRLSEEKRLYQGEHSLFILSSWRLDSPAGVICGGEDDNTEEGPMQHGLRQIVGHAVASFRLAEPGLDLELGFGNGLALRVFCDETDPREGDDNYQIFQSDRILVVETRSRVNAEPCDPKHAPAPGPRPLSSRRKVGGSIPLPQPAPIRPLASELRADLGRLVGQPLWGFTAGKGEGTSVHLQLGRKIPRRRPLAGRGLTDEQRRFSPEYRLSLSCAWRLDSEAEVVCGGKDDRSEDGPLRGGLRRLVGQSLESVELTEPGMDLRLRFANGWTLPVFCDHVNEIDRLDNFRFSVPGAVYVAGTAGALRREKRGGSRSAPPGPRWLGA